MEDLNLAKRRLTDLRKEDKKSLILAKLGRKRFTFKIAK